MRYTLPGFVYSVGLPPVIAAAAKAALDLIIAEPERVSAVRSNANYFLGRAQHAGLATGAAIGHGIVPVHFADLKTTMAAADALMREGIYAPPIVQVGVPKGLPRIRFFISANHTCEQIDRTVEVLERFSAGKVAAVQSAVSMTA